MKFKIVILCASLLASVGCSSQKIRAPSSVNGRQNAQSLVEENICQIVAINPKQDGETISEMGYCSATVISDDAILTAGSCMAEAQAQASKGRVQFTEAIVRCSYIDEETNEKKREERTIGPVWNHPWFSGPTQPQYDLAVFKVTKKFEKIKMYASLYSDEVQMVNDAKVPQACRFAGYLRGQINPEGDLAGYVIDSVQWDRNNQKLEASSVNQIAGGEQGGPLLCKDKHGIEKVAGVAVTNQISGLSANEKKVSVFSSVPFLKNWIDFSLTNKRLLDQQEFALFEFTEFKLEVNKLLDCAKEIAEKKISRKESQFLEFSRQFGEKKVSEISEMFDGLKSVPENKKEVAAREIRKRIMPQFAPIVDGVSLCRFIKKRS